MVLTLKIGKYTPVRFIVNAHISSYGLFQHNLLIAAVSSNVKVGVDCCAAIGGNRRVPAIRAYRNFDL